jgi:hypothetical protein
MRIMNLGKEYYSASYQGTYNVNVSSIGHGKVELLNKVGSAKLVTYTLSHLYE